MAGRVWNMREKLLGGRVFGEFWSLIGLVSAGLALSFERTTSEGGSAEQIGAASLWLTILAGVAVLLAGVSVVYNAARFMESDSADAAKARRLAFGRGFLWILLAGGAALVAGILGLREASSVVVGVIGFLSLVGWAFGEGLNVMQQFIGRRVEPDAMLKFRAVLDAIFSIAKTVGIVLMCCGAFLPIGDAKIGLLATGIIVAGLGALLNLLMGAVKLWFRIRS